MIQLLHIQPITLNYNITLVFMLNRIGFQIVTGIFLVMFYSTNASLAFLSVEHLMRDVLMDGF
jgi:quinol-cytochrome oxidoreductase complex cytochrome b subunit